MEKQASIKHYNKTILTGTDNNFLEHHYHRRHHHRYIHIIIIISSKSPSSAEGLTLTTKEHAINSSSAQNSGCNGELTQWVRTGRGRQPTIDERQQQLSNFNAKLPAYSRHAPDESEDTHTHKKNGLSLFTPFYLCASNAQLPHLPLPAALPSGLPATLTPSPPTSLGAFPPPLPTTTTL